MMLFNTWSICTILLLIEGIAAFFSVNDDLYSSPKYVIRQIRDNPYTFQESQELLSLQNITGSYESMKTTDGDYLCYIPETAKDMTAGQDSHLKDKIHDTSLYTEAVEKALHEKCLFSASGYWMYAFCYNKELAQFHGLVDQYRSGNALKYILGKFSKTGKVKEKLALNKESDTWYLRENIEGGTICDLTGNPRSAEIHYVCDPNSPVATLSWVKEYKTCGYLLQVNVPELCQFELLRSNQQETTNEIVCKKVEDSTNIESDDILSLSEYSLRTLGDHFFLATPKYQGKLFVLLFTSPDESNLLNHVIHVFANTMMKKSFFYKDVLQNPKDIDYITYQTHVYDHARRFLTTLEISYKDGVISVTGTDNKLDFKSNIKKFGMKSKSDIRERSGDAKATQQLQDVTQPEKEETNDNSDAEKNLQRLESTQNTETIQISQDTIIATEEAEKGNEASDKKQVTKSVGHDEL